VLGASILPLSTTVWYLYFHFTDYI